MSKLYAFIPFRGPTCLFIADWPRTGILVGDIEKEGERRERFQLHFFTSWYHGLGKPALLASDDGLCKSPKYLVVQQALKWHRTRRSGCPCGVMCACTKMRRFIALLSPSKQIPLHSVLGHLSDNSSLLFSMWSFGLI